MGIHDGHREKMRHRFCETGLEGFADHEALELLLYYAIPRRDTNELAHRLLARYGSLAALLQAPLEDLQRTEGIGESAAVFLKLVPAFVYQAQRSAAGQDTILNSTEKAGRYLLARFAGERNEVRRLVENALLSSASAVILSHNHPSGIALPSREDYTTTRRVQEALATIGVELLDHIIVAEDDYVSLADSGILQR